ncbi:MAG: CCA tRNA nucleotidyltransferase [archaeon]|nr:CCA tRNA nucleotidyltransferase [archaeon]
MNELNKVIEEALKLVEPSKEEIDHVKALASIAFQKVSKVASDSKFKPSVVLGGSYAKGTWLKGEADIDIFVKFPKDLEKKELEKYGLDIALNSMKGYNPVLRYSEHPYVEACIEDVKVNVVPCYDVKKGEWKSAADRSPYHTEFMVKALDDDLRREVRMLKKFMKGIGVYGAEIAIQGFSGYVCEVLSINYGSFISTLKSASRWAERELISLKKVDEDFKKLFPQAGIIILDPVDYRRNLGTAISQKRLAEFILASRFFLEKPSINYFLSKKDYSLNKLEKSDLIENLVTLKFKHSKRSIDILWGQLKRSLNHILKQLDIHNFKVIRANCATDEIENSAFIFLMERIDQPSIEIKIGPTVFRHDDSIKFIEKNIKTSKIIWLGDDARLYAMIERRVKNLDDFFYNLIHVPKGGSGIAPGLINDIANTYEVHIGKDNFNVALSMPWLAKELVKIVSSDRLLTE